MWGLVVVCCCSTFSAVAYLGGAAAQEAVSSLSRMLTSGADAAGAVALRTANLSVAVSDVAVCAGLVFPWATGAGHRPPAGASKKAIKLAESYIRVPKSMRSAHKARPSYWLGNDGVGIAFA